MTHINFYPHPDSNISKADVERIRQEADRHLQELDKLMNDLGYWGHEENCHLAIKFTFRDEHPYGYEEREVDGEVHNLWASGTITDEPEVIKEPELIELPRSGDEELPF